MNSKAAILINALIHDRIYKKYGEIHGEIFNDIEQNRLHDKLSKAVSFIRTHSGQRKALDFGCGSGNLTRHLLDLDFYVVSADISQKFLEHICTEFGRTKKSETIRLNGQDISNVENNQFDFVAAYSVLHHVPDYFRVIQEMVRVTKPGGVIFLDHEKNPLFWNADEVRDQFMRLVTPPPPPKKWIRFFNPKKYIIKIRDILMPRYQAEGDIHVWPDDHIEWEKIERLLLSANCEVVMKEDYLLYQRGFPIEIYRSYKNRCADMRLLVVQKQ